ncbi:DUF4942 domain-containing protein [Moritella sp. F3]|uniref:DUF4942 domain-containing protein n=1 Tax=Moritella sp. F3 TaxID=2718882 RepID=UPI0018E1502B|nr:DUF4942 domain-containing protein [Moritella sp. F3]GIC77684.1 hypothetical protein FMO001_24110 [Moritella sp. F1]GIC82097.1 hypothetical protein FMO003_23780 [Moritella sp. F3]
MNATKQLVQQIKAVDQDFEWYPSTNEILEVIKADMDENLTSKPSILDVGAGDGRALEYLTEGKKFAIEKSVPLLNALNKNVFVVGTDFYSQTLIDKSVDTVFCNPPYSEFIQWVIKIITEANAKSIYFVIPKRWEDSNEIANAIESRKAKSEVLGRFDFLNADRSARVEVDIVKIKLRGDRAYFHSSKPTVDPFKLWFGVHFKIEISKTEVSSSQQKINSVKDLNDKVSTELIKEQDLITTLDSFYQRDLEKLISTYSSLSGVSPDILKELNINLDGVREALQLKVSSLKDVYWNELFNRLSSITDRLTSSSRKVLLGTLLEHTHVDFNPSNAHGILIWVIKHSNSYFDSQLMEVLDTLTTKANLINYKSNQKTFGKDEWRYNYDKPHNLDRYSLDYRFVLADHGGLNNGCCNRVKGLADRSADLLDDICAIAANIGFDTKGTSRANSFDWSSNGSKTFLFRDTNTGEMHILFDVRAYQNRNLHFRFNQELICKLNVEFGRLKGWLRTSSQAAEELDIDIDIANQSFSTNLRLGSTSGLFKLGLNIAA